MRIHDHNPTGPSVNETGKSHETSRTSGTGSLFTGSTGGGEDRVEFSNALGTLSRALASDDSNRSDRVSQLAAQFGGGSYQPNFAGASQGIVEDALVAGGR